MNPFTFIKYSYNHETPLKAKTLEKLKIQLARSGTARILQLGLVLGEVTAQFQTS